MMWPFRPQHDPLLDPEVLDELLADRATKANVVGFLDHVRQHGLDLTPESVTDFAREEGMERGAILLLIALAGRLELLR